jgi:hypothetical protein
VGDIVSIPLGQDRYAFGWVLEEPLVAIFDYLSTESAPPVDLVARHNVAFKIWVMNHAFTKGTWPTIGHKELGDAEREKPYFFKQDPISGSLSITRDGSEETPASQEEVIGLECAAVWEPSHVIDRINDYFAGVPNRWVTSLAPR